MRLIVFLFLSLASGASACGSGELLFLSCTVDGGSKRVEVCHSAETARYSFGPDAVPELEITRPVGDVHLTPWPGIGRTIWEEVVFLNEGHSYTVYGSIDRAPPPSEDSDIVVTVAGGVVVSKEGAELAHLHCDDGSVDFPWSNELYDAKEAAGQCYDPGSHEWRTCDAKD